MLGTSVSKGGKGKRAAVTSQSERLLSDRERCQDIVEMTLIHSVDNDKDSLFRIHATEAYCLCCEAECSHNTDEDDDDYEECECSCDEQMTANIELSIPQAVELVRVMRTMFDDVGHPQMHVINEDATYILTAGGVQ